MNIAEAALYGDLVRYLRDRWAEQAAEFNESSFKQEQAQIDALIRQWFFQPQDELHGYCPRDIIRNEEQGKPNTVSHDHLDEMFFDDCPVCNIMRNASPGDDIGQWSFGIAPDLSLLDEYDREGYDAKWAEEDKRQVRFEARDWMQKNQIGHCFAGNRFQTTAGALAFVNELYSLGAATVWVTNILAEEWRLAEEGGPYADTLIVQMPEDSRQCADIHAVFEREIEHLQGDVDLWESEDELHFWWD